MVILLYIDTTWQCFVTNVVFFNRIRYILKERRKKITRFDDIIIYYARVYVFGRLVRRKRLYFNSQRRRSISIVCAVCAQEESNRPVCLRVINTNANSYYYNLSFIIDKNQLAARGTQTGNGVFLFRRTTEKNSYGNKKQFWTRNSLL